MPTQWFALVVPGYWTALLLHLECIIMLWFYIILSLNFISFVSVVLSFTIPKLNENNFNEDDSENYGTTAKSRCLPSFSLKQSVKVYHGTL